MAPIDINNQDINSITLNGNTDVDTVTVNGQEVFSSATPVSEVVANGSFENSTFDGNRQRPDDWTFFDSTNTSDDSGVFYVATESWATDGNKVLYNGYTSNSFGNENRVEQDMDLTNVSGFVLDKRGVVNSPRAELILQIDGQDVANYGRWADGRIEIDVSRTIPSFLGVHTVAFAWRQFTGDNLGNSQIDNIRAF